jgi:hypothetical protein
MRKIVLLLTLVIGLWVLDAGITGGRYRDDATRDLQAAAERFNRAVGGLLDWLGPLGGRSASGRGRVILSVIDESETGIDA